MRNDVCSAHLLPGGIAALADLGTTLSTTGAAAEMERDLASCGPYGLTKLEPDLHRVTVPTADGASHDSSNVYVLGTGPVILIDAGSDDPSDTLTQAVASLGNPTVSEIFLTHAHLDHAGGTIRLSARAGAKVWLPQGEFDEQTRERLPDLHVDCWLEPGDLVEHERWSLDVVATPGHSPGHVSFVDRKTGVCFAGDLISGQGTIAVVSPRGSMADYIESLMRLKACEITTIFPGHGPIVYDGIERIEDYLQRRHHRENQILELVAEGVSTLDQLMDAIYPGVSAGTRRLARGTIRAHVEKLLKEGIVVATATNIDSANLWAVERK